MPDTYKALIKAKSIQGVHAFILIRKVTSPATTDWTMIRDSSYEIKLKGSGKETPNTVDGMLRTPGLNDYSLSFKGFTNPDDPIEDNILPNDTVDFRCFRSGSYTADATSGAISAVTGDHWAGRALIGECGVSTGATDVEEWDVSGDKQSGVLTLPSGETW